MKKVLFIAIVAVASLASCKKDRVCTCTTTDASSGTTSIQEITYFEAKKGDARQLCAAQATQTKTTSGSVSVTGDKTTCEFK
ncbi:MAG: hypothetical protein A3F72_17410 [Bacteroidetes bacterium RIFCSPLOWO2_12_FULL_35_15]|nr:MAG: hypothetical protein A3F72_17410 [Bacteroidetes bacterium RIFCSPLOWO2_12_FULL_35_15]